MRNYKLIFLLLSNIVFAGTMTNPTINTGQGGLSTFGKGGDGGNVIYNDKKNKNINIKLGKAGVSTFNENGQDGKIFINNQYLDIKKCFNQLNILYNEDAEIILINNKNIKINNKIIKLDRCLVKENNK